MLCLRSSMYCMGGKGDSAIRVNRLTRIAEERQDGGTHERDVEHAPKASAAAHCGGIGSKSVRARQAHATGTKRRENFNLSRAAASVARDQQGGGSQVGTVGVALDHPG